MPTDIPLTPRSRDPHDPVRVLWLVKGLGPGGAERLLVNHARVRDRDGFRYEVGYLVPWKRHLVGDLEDLDVPVTELTTRREWDLRWVWRLRKQLTRHPVDVVHAHSPYVAAFSRLAVRSLPRRRRPAFVYTEHNRWPRHSRPTRLLNRVTLGLDDADLAVSEDVRASMPSTRQARVEVLTHGIDVEAVRAGRSRRASTREELGGGADDVVVGIVANLRREKAYDVLLRAAAKVVSDGPTVCFVSVGQGPLEDELRTLRDELGLGDRFRFLGFRDDPIPVMAGFDVFCLSSRHEGLPVSLMEALALGLPTVATAVGGIPEAVRDDVEGVLVPPDDPARLAGAITALASDEPRRRRLASAAATRAEIFGVEPGVRRQETIYRQLAGRR